MAFFAAVEAADVVLVEADAAVVVVDAEPEVDAAGFSSRYSKSGWLTEARAYLRRTGTLVSVRVFLQLYAG